MTKTTQDINGCDNTCCTGNCFLAYCDTFGFDRHDPNVFSAWMVHASL